MANTIFLHDISSAQINIRNIGAVDLTSIEVIDQVPDGFELKNDTDLRWNLGLRAGEERSYSYSLKPLQSGNYTVPAAIALFTINGTKYVVKSNTTQIIVHGPRLVLTKTISSTIAALGGYITITVVVRNEGDMPAIINVTDFLPSAVSIVKGNLGLREVLDKDEVQSFNYTITMNKVGKIDIPAAKVDFTYPKGNNNFTVMSKNLTILVIDPSTTMEKVTPTNTPAATRTSTPGFEGLIALIALLITYAINRKRSFWK